MSGIDLSLTNHPIVVLENNGVIWVFESNEQNNFICRYSIDGGKKWYTSEVLMSSFSGEFDITFDIKDNLHLACIDSKGQLFYMVWNGELWTKKNIPLDGTAKTVSIAVHKETVDLVYLTFTSEQINQWHLMHTRIKGNKRLSESSIDSGEGNYLNKGVIAYDNEGNLHIIYRSYEGNSYQLLYTSMLTMKSSWQKPYPIGQQADNTTPCLLTDDKGDLHLTYTVSDGKNLRVAYSRRSQVTGWLMPEWTPLMYLSSEGHNAYTPTLIIADTRVLALWQQVEGIYRRISLNGGQDWENVYRDQHFDDMINLTPYKFSEAKENNYKLSTFGSTTSDIMLIAASYLSKEEFLSPTPMELGNHIIFDLKDNIKYLPKGMHLFARLLHNHLYTLINTFTKENVSDKDDLLELKQNSIMISELNKQIDTLKKHSAALSAKMNENLKELESKDILIKELKERLLENNDAEPCQEPDNHETQLRKKDDKSQTFKISLKYK